MYKDKYMHLHMFKPKKKRKKKISKTISRQYLDPFCLPLHYSMGLNLGLSSFVDCERPNCVRGRVWIAAQGQLSSG